MTKRLLIATTNGHKISEIRSILAGAPFELVTLADSPPVRAPEETGRTFAENARLKAMYYARATGALTVCDDSGLEIDALGGKPGVESARFGGTGLPYPERFALIEQALRSQPNPDRRARFVCAVALARGDRILFECAGVAEGLIVPVPRGTGGFGYDPIFLDPALGLTFAEAGDRKHAVSHRARAFGALRSFLMGDDATQE